MSKIRRKSNHQTYTSLWVHLIWSTKNREPLITSSLKKKLYDKIREISGELNYHLDFINGVDDHVHLLYSLNPVHSVSEMVKNVKGKTWQWVRDMNLSESYFSWQDGYAAISVSPQNVQRVRNYIRKQETHHAKETFENELESFKKLGIVLENEHNQY